ncbi:hypothetical protein Droror1_Dr00011727 [Drosera rotundifolia]
MLQYNVIDFKVNFAFRRSSNKSIAPKPNLLHSYNDSADPSNSTTEIPSTTEFLQTPFQIPAKSQIVGRKTEGFHIGDSKDFIQENRRTVRDLQHWNQELEFASFRSGYGESRIQI